MRNILALVGAGLLGVAGLGWYLGWYHVQATPTSDGHQHISIDVDQKKVAADIKHGVKEGTQHVENFIKQETGSGTPFTPQPVEGSPDYRPVTNSYRVKNGSLEFTGEVSVPQPVTK